MSSSTSTRWFVIAGLVLAIGLVVLFVMLDGPETATRTAVAPSQPTESKPSPPAPALSSSPELVSEPESPPPPPPSSPDGQPDSLTRDQLDRARTEARAAARHCMPAAASPTFPKEGSTEVAQADRSEQRIRMRYLVRSKGGTTTIARVELLETDIREKTIERCIVDSIAKAQWASNGHDARIALMDQFQLEELERPVPPVEITKTD